MTERVEVTNETDAYRIVRRYSDAGWTDAVEWKDGHEPATPPTVDELRASVEQATSLDDVKGALLDVIDHVTGQQGATESPTIDTAGRSVVADEHAPGDVAATTDVAP